MKVSECWTQLIECAYVKNTWEWSSFGFTPCNAICTLVACVTCTSEPTGFKELAQHSCFHQDFRSSCSSSDWRWTGTSFPTAWRRSIVGKMLLLYMPPAELSCPSSTISSMRCLQLTTRKPRSFLLGSLNLGIWTRRSKTYSMPGLLRLLKLNSSGWGPCDWGKFALRLDTWKNYQFYWWTQNENV